MEMFSVSDSKVEENLVTVKMTQDMKVTLRCLSKRYGISQSNLVVQMVSYCLVNCDEQMSEHLGVEQDA